jgi:uncharacterized protein
MPDEPDHDRPSPASRVGSDTSSASQADVGMPAESSAGGPAAPVGTPNVAIGVPPEASPNDPVVPDPQASYDRAAAAPLADLTERAIVSSQLGRPARGRSAVVHRCAWGLPTVVRVDPRLPDGTPFPTVFWQTCPALRSQIGRLEADQSMVGINQRLDTEPDFQQAHAEAQERYRRFRDDLDGPLPGDPYAGGNPRYVKCLHVHAGHELATGDSPVGSWTIEAARPVPCSGPCVDAAEVAAWSDRLRAEGIGPDPDQ